jgi:hypothetical protein
MNIIGVAAAAAVIATCALPAAAQQTSRVPQQQAQQSQVPDTTVKKVGSALRHVAMIRENYTQRSQSVSSQQQRQAMADQAETDAMKAVSDEGLSLQQYNQVIQLAKSDPQLRDRLLTVAQSKD